MRRSMPKGAKWTSRRPENSASGGGQTVVRASAAGFEISCGRRIRSGRSPRYTGGAPL